ncbi:hypothetical protein ACP4OV_022878 [Aristida adscensionis]
MQPSTSKRLPKCCGASPSYIMKTPRTSPTDSPSHKSTAEEVGITGPLNSVGFQKSWLVFLMGCNMTSEQKAKLDAFEQKLRPQIPLYITAMDMISVTGGFLAMSKDYVTKYNLSKNETIKVSQPDRKKSWNVNLDTNTVGSYALATGWSDFIRDHRLQEGDICIFEPSESKRRVTLIFHPLEEIFCSHSQGYVHPPRSPTHGFSEPGIRMPRSTILNDQQWKKVRQQVEAIQSASKIYVAVMQHSNIIRSPTTLHFGVDYAMYLPLGNQTMRLRHPGKDDTREAELHVKKGRYTLVRGWNQFVDDNKLDLGDICLFQKMENEEKLTMTVHIIRKSECS